MSEIAYDSTRQALYHPEFRETVFVHGQTYSPLQLAIEAARLAYVRGEESAAQQERLRDAMARCGFDSPVSFNDLDTDSQAFGCLRAADGAALVAFRGTQPDRLADLAIDLDAHVVEWPEASGSVHEGFARAARSLMPAISEWMSRAGVARESLTLCGHSLGAALATLCASVWQPARLITIGSPRVGDAVFAATLAPVACTRIVECCDAITEVPPALGRYVHAGPATYITRDGQALTGATDESIANDRAAARRDYFENHAWRIGSVLVRDLADHAPINYLRAFFD